MKKLLLLFVILMFSVITTACINNLAVQELNNKAASYIDKGDIDAAICRLKASLDLDDQFYQTHYNLASAYNAAGNYEESVKEAYKALELNPALYDAYYIAAVSKEAAAYKLIENNNPDADENEAKTQDEEKLAAFNAKAAEAVSEYEKYLEKAPNAPEKENILRKIDDLKNQISPAAASAGEEADS